MVIFLNVPYFLLANLIPILPLDGKALVLVRVNKSLQPTIATIGSSSPHLSLNLSGQINDALNELFFL